MTILHNMHITYQILIEDICNMKVDGLLCKDKTFGWNFEFF